MRTRSGPERKADTMPGERERSEALASVARRRIDRLTLALRQAQVRGEVGKACEPEAVAQFLVASLEGAVLVAKLTSDPAVIQRCVSEIHRYLTLYEIPS